MLAGSTELWEQLEGGAALRARGVNFEHGDEATAVARIELIATAATSTR